MSNLELKQRDQNKYCSKLLHRCCWASCAWSQFLYTIWASELSFARRSRMYWISLLSVIGQPSELSLGRWNTSLGLCSYSRSKGENPVEAWSLSCTPNNRWPCLKPCLLKLTTWQSHPLYTAIGPEHWISLQLFFLILHTITYVIFVCTNECNTANAFKERLREIMHHYPNIWPII